MPHWLRKNLDNFDKKTMEQYKLNHDVSSQQTLDEPGPEQSDKPYAIHLTPTETRQFLGLKDKEPLSAVKYDGGKIRLDLIPFDALDEIARALEYGAIKYSEGQWEGGFEWRRLIGATLRHVTSWARGQDKDLESGVSHLAHAGAMILFLLSHELRGLGKDNRFKY